MPPDPAKLQIVRYPAHALRAKCQPVKAVDDGVRAVAARMIELMHAAPGIGLAAPQVGLNWSMFVVDIPHDPEDGDPGDNNPMVYTPTPQVYINPKLTGYTRDLVPMEEGCLSLPDITGEVRRPTACTITAIGLDGEPFTQHGTGLLARCWQHEYDHLEGVLIIDKFSPRDKRRNKGPIADLEAGARTVI